jgi:cellulose synthase/poly-beta-1,6-N-acetylglucosamine synthase-like glycosyltransferase
MVKQFIVGFDTGIKTAGMTTRRPSISVVYPMFNEEENIERAVRFAESVLTDMTSDYEILIVNDASTDRSAEIAEALARSNLCVQVFHHERNFEIRRRASHRLQQSDEGSTIEYGTERPSDVKDTLADVDKTQRAAGFRPVCNLAGGLHTTIQFFRNDPATIEQSRHI